ncbi:Kinesin-like protein [Sergentomyia squamirostris]
MSHSFINSRDPSIDIHHRPMPQRIERLEPLLLVEEDEEDADDAASGSAVTGTDADISLVGGEKADVFLRLRRPDSQDLHDEGRKMYNVTMTGLKVTKNDGVGHGKAVAQLYSFTRIFEPLNNQRDIYHLAIKKNIDKEEHGVFLTYGTSGSGKTYTLLGTNQEPGVIPRAIEQIFARYENKIAAHPTIKYANAKFIPLTDRSSKKERELTQKIISCPDAQFGTYDYVNMHRVIEKEEAFYTEEKSDDDLVFIWVSFMEIYNEKINDLLRVSDQTGGKESELKVMCNKGKPYVKNLTQVYVKSSEDVFKVLNYGLNRIKCESTAVNVSSSRSHSLFNIIIIKFSKTEDYTCISYRFGDLAGSERLRKTQNVGDRLREAQNINKSLMVLGKCLTVLHENRLKKQSNVVPFRESQLTLLIQTALLGKENLILIVNLNPIEAFYEENLHVLDFSSIAREIVHEYKSPCKVNKARFSLHMAQMVNPQGLDAQAQEAFLDENYRLTQALDMLQTENAALKSENDYLQLENDQLHEHNDQLKERLQNVLSDLTDKEMKIKQDLIDDKELCLQRQKEFHKRALEIELRRMKIDYEYRIRQLEYEIEDLKDERENDQTDDDSDSVIDLDDLDE